MDTLPSPDDSPEVAIVKAVVSIYMPIFWWLLYACGRCTANLPSSPKNAFCASGSPDSNDAGSEVLHLPTIVDSAESSPTAARSAASILRKQLDLKNNATRPYMQYNAIMLLRILSDNPGPTFTRNLAEPKFVSAVKCLLREGKDPSVRQILGETLEYFETTKGYDEGLRGLHELWSKEKKKNLVLRTSPPLQTATPPPGQYQSIPPPMGPRPTRSPPGLPPMSELVARIAEAQTSASLLSQLLQSTPQLETPDNELVKEFADRCKSASRSVVAYISADPPPDEDTLTTLIETNDVLTLALSEWKKAVNVAQMTALEEARRQGGDSRIVDVADIENPAYSATAGERAVGVGESGMGEVRRMDAAPSSPVSPVVSPTSPANF